MSKKMFVDFNGETGQDHGKSCRWFMYLKHNNEGKELVADWLYGMVAVAKQNIYVCFHIHTYVCVYALMPYICISFVLHFQITPTSWKIEG